MSTNGSKAGLSATAELDLVHSAFGPQQLVARSIFLPGGEVLHRTRHQRGNQAGPEPRVILRAQLLFTRKFPVSRNIVMSVIADRFPSVDTARLKEPPKRCALPARLPLR